MELSRIFRRADIASAAALSVPLPGDGPVKGAAVPAAVMASAPFARGPRSAHDDHRPLPPALVAYRPIRAEQLEAGARHALTKLFQNIPSPPRTLHRLLAPERAGDGPPTLAEVLAAIPRLSGRVHDAALAAGLDAHVPLPPAGTAGEAAGVAMTRSLAVRCLLHGMFRSEDPQRQALLDTAWQASTLACAITDHLGRRVRLADASALVCRTALTFLGRLATVVAMPGGLLARVPARGWLQRCAAEQALLGLSSAEIGRQLMRAWELPPALADEAAEVDAVLFAPHAAWEPQRARRLAVCYLSARLGERLAADPALEPADVDLAGDADPELHQLRSYLADPALASVARGLRDVTLRDQVRRWRAIAPSVV